MVRALERGALFCDLADGPDVENSKIVKEGEDRDDADRGDHEFVVRAKSAIAAHINSPPRKSDAHRPDASVIGAAKCKAAQMTSVTGRAPGSQSIIVCFPCQTECEQLRTERHSNRRGGDRKGARFPEHLVASFVGGA